MSKRAEAAIARAGALDRLESLVNEAQLALDKACTELKQLEMGSEAGCEVYNDVTSAAVCVRRAAKVVPTVR